MQEDKDNKKDKQPFHRQKAKRGNGHPRFANAEVANIKQEREFEGKRDARRSNYGDGKRDARRDGKNDALHKELKSGVVANVKLQKNAQNPHYKLNLNSKAKIRITPLGGLGEVGANMMVMESEKSAIIIDVGMSFAEEQLHGVNILVPDFSYLHAIKNKIAGVIITHAHEDHIGGVPYLYKEFNFPLYGTPLPLALIGAKFDEHGLKAAKSHFRIVQKRNPITIGDFEVEWIHITHSIIDSSALAIKTEAGTIIHTGDFKVDHTPIDNLPSDLNRLAYYGENGVLLMLSDSTNSHRPGSTASEASVAPRFDSLFKSAKGRIIMSTFSSNIHRVYQAISFGMKYNRKVAVIGRSMEKNLEIARELGYINLPREIFIEAHEVESQKDDEVLIVTTGSQGETMSALYRMATDEHRHIKIKPTDTIILSSKAIPGNEGNVSTVLNFLMKAGAEVAYQDMSDIHVSGHASQEEQKLMLRLIKPKFFLPVHGEYNHVSKHKETAIKCDVLEKNIILMENGDQIEVNPNYMKKIRTVKNGKTYIDNNTYNIVDSIVVNERQNLAECGLLILFLSVDRDAKKMLPDTKITTLGLLNPDQEESYIKELIQTLEMHIKTIRDDTVEKNLEADVRDFMRKILFKKFKKYPAIVIYDKKSSNISQKTSDAKSGEMHRRPRERKERKGEEHSRDGEQGAHSHRPKRGDRGHGSREHSRGRRDHKMDSRENS